MSFFSNIKLITDYLGTNDDSTIQFEPTYHRVAQSFSKWPVVINDNGYKIKLFEWGVIADYMNTPEKIKEYRNSMANIRSERSLMINVRSGTGSGRTGAWFLPPVSSNTMTPV
jgi:hypothetical protein